VAYRPLPLSSLWHIALTPYVIRTTQLMFGADALTRPTRAETNAQRVDGYDRDIESSSFSAKPCVWHRWIGDVDSNMFEAMNGLLKIIGEPDRYDEGDFHWHCYRC